MTETSSASWAFEERDSRQIADILDSFLLSSQARYALLVDRSGQLVATAGERPGLDTATFASLAAADFAANEQLAALIGEREFSTLVHQGERDSVYLADVARRIILVVLFDRRSAVGLVRIKARGIVQRLARVFEEVFRRPATGAATLETAWSSEAEHEIDRLFGSL